MRSDLRRFPSDPGEARPGREQERKNVAVQLRVTQCSACKRVKVDSSGSSSSSSSSGGDDTPSPSASPVLNPRVVLRAPVDRPDAKPSPPSEKDSPPSSRDGESRRPPPTARPPVSDQMDAKRLDESRPADNKEERVEILKEEPLKPPARDPRRKSSLFGRLRKSMRRKNWKPARKVLDSHDLSPPEQQKTLGWKPKIPESLSTYRMKPEGVRGRAIIFNHKVFDSKLRLLPREGTEADVKNLSRVLSARGLHVQVHHDLTYKKLIRELKDIATEEKALASHDCFVVCFLSHGKEGRLYARDRDFDELELWREFYGDRCEALIGKPKMFFVQACRGRTPDSGVKGKHARRGWYPHHDTTDGEGGGHRGEHGDYHLPTHADLLIAQASYEGQVAWKNEDLGSYFIYTLCEVMERHSETLDVLKMLTMVSEIIALQFKSSHDEPEYHDKKQIPTIRSTLISEVYLKPIPRH